jgi:hypothetical protein
MMAYIQLALLGCAGHVIVGNSLSPEPPKPENVWQLPLGAISRTSLEGFFHQQA